MRLWVAVVVTNEVGQRPVTDKIDDIAMAEPSDGSKSVMIDREAKGEGEREKGKNC